MEQNDLEAAPPMRTEGRESLIGTVIDAWEAHSRSLSYEARQYWWESATSYEVAALAVDAIMAKFPDDNSD